MTSSKKIWLDEPEITEDDIRSVADSLRAGQISTAHKTVVEFEKAMSTFLSVPDCLATNSGTSALHLALIAAGAGPNVNVVVPALSFVATANAVKYTGANIVFMDVDPETWTIFGRPLEIDLSDGIFLPVFLYGGEVPTFDVVYGAIEARNPKVVFDFAEGIGLQPPSMAKLQSFYCYSFNGNKTITGGAGGLVACQYPDDYMIGMMRDMVAPRTYKWVAYNYRMPSLNAALVLSQMRRVQNKNTRKLEIAKIYKELLPEVKFQKGIENGLVWMVAGLFPESVEIEKLQESLLSRGIPSRRVFKPLNYYPHLNDDQFYPNAEFIYEHGLCLPSSVKNTDDDIEYVCKTIKELVFG